MKKASPAEKTEILVLDDHSEDRTAEWVSAFERVRLIPLEEEEAGKKAAIQRGVREANGAVILTTDGDCIVGKSWASTMISALEENGAALVTGPLSLTGGASFIRRYQELEQAALNLLTSSGISTGWIYSGSGANLVFHREIFLRLDPYAENRSIESGDDVFLIQKIREEGGKVEFAARKEAVVFTDSLVNFSDLAEQRLRWIGKTPAYRHLRTRIYLALFLLMNISIVLLFLLTFYRSAYWTWFFYAFMIKFVTDYVLISAGMKWLHRPVCWQDILKSGVFQIFLVVYLGVMSLVRKKYRWKGREVS